MKITVMSRSKAVRFFREMTSVEKEPFACIAIKGLPDEDIPRRYYPYLTLSMTFDDVDMDNKDKREYAITNGQANHIARFVKSLPNTIETLIVHCEAGMSRSAGVAAAIMKWLYNDDSQIFDQPSYRPNMTCYRKTLNALMDESTDSMTDELAERLLMKFVSGHPHGDYDGFKILEKEYEAMHPHCKVIAFQCNYTWMLHGWDKNATQSFAVIHDFVYGTYSVAPGLVERYQVEL